MTEYLDFDVKKWSLIIVQGFSGIAMLVGTLGGLTSVYKHRLFSFSYAILTFVTFLIFTFLGSAFIILKSKPWV